MKLAFWPGVGGGAKTLVEIEPVLRERDIDVVTLDPRYPTRSNWRLDVLADELASTGADVYAGHSWGAAIAATAAVAEPPAALVLLDGGHVDRRDLPRFGAAPTTDGRVAEIRKEHETYRWPSVDAYLDFCRTTTPRWSELLEEAALDGLERRGDEVLPPFDADRLEEIIRGYEEYDAEETLRAIPDHVRVLFVAANADDDHAAARNEVLERLGRLVPHVDVRRVACGHDVVWGLGSELGALIADWLAEA